MHIRSWTSSPPPLNRWLCSLFNVRYPNTVCGPFMSTFRRNNSMSAYLLFRVPSRPSHRAAAMRDRFSASHLLSLPRGRNTLKRFAFVPLKEQKSRTGRGRCPPLNTTHYNAVLYTFTCLFIPSMDICFVNIEFVLGSLMSWGWVGD